MALKKCRECGNEVSTRADKCPNCGSPVKTKDIGCAGWVLIILAISIALSVIGGIVDNTDTTPSAPTPFNAIDAVKARVPVENKGRMWYIGEWTLKKLGDGIWEVRVSDGIWKVSTGATMCAEDGNLVDICSANGTAQRYSEVLFCNPQSMCEP